MVEALGGRVGEGRELAEDKRELLGASVCEGVSVPMEVEEACPEVERVTHAVPLKVGGAEGREERVAVTELVNEAVASTDKVGALSVETGLVD